MTSKFNAAFIGGGLVSTIGLGGYAEVYKEIEFTSFSGASIGSLNAVCLAAGKNPYEIRDFLVENVEDFCSPIVGKGKIQRSVDEFLNGILFKDLPVEVLVSITPMRRRFPNVITRENASNLTAGEVIALSASMPGMFLPGLVKLEGKYAIVWDGGIVLNPPLNPETRNVIFSYNNAGSLVNTFWNRKRWAQEANAEVVFHPRTSLGILGSKDDVKTAFELGQKYMFDEKKHFLMQVEFC